MHIKKLGIIGINEEIVQIFVRGLVEQDRVKPNEIFILSKQNNTFSFPKAVHLVEKISALVDQCEIVILASLPEEFISSSLVFGDQLVISMMSGVKHEQIAQHTKAKKIVRIIPSKAAMTKSAFLPWMSFGEVEELEIKRFRYLFEAFGVLEQIQEEKLLDVFSVLTGHGEVWLGYFAKIFIDFAIKQGVEPEIAERAVFQTLQGLGKLFNEDKETFRMIFADNAHMDLIEKTGLQAFDNLLLKDWVTQGLESALKQVYRT